MRYLKKYGKMFESNDEAVEVPSWFIPLDQIGHWLDPRKGYIYPMLKREGYYYPTESYDAEEYFLENEEAIEQFDEGQVDEILKDYRSSEPIAKGKIDMGLVNEIVDLAISEEIIDMGMVLRVWVWIDGVLVWSVSSEEGEGEFMRLWIEDYEKVQKGGEVEYRIGWKNIDTVESYNAFKGFCQRLGAMHPDENITASIAGNKRVEEFRLARFDMGVLRDRMRNKG